MPRRTDRWMAERRARLAYALKAKEPPMTLKAWSRVQGVSHTHLNFVLRGIRESGRLDALVHGEIAAAFGKPIGDRYLP